MDDANMEEANQWRGSTFYRIFMEHLMEKNRDKKFAYMNINE